MATAQSLASSQPTSADAQRTLGIAHYRNNDLIRSREALNKALEFDPEHSAALSTLAALEQHAGNPDRARRLAERLIDARPQTATGYKLLGDALLAEGDIEGATHQYHIAADKPDGARFSVSSQFSLAAAYHREGRMDDAIAAYEKIVSLEPDDALALNDLVWFLHSEGHDSALAIAERAHALKPDNAAFADTLGWILIEQIGSDTALQRGVDLLQVALASVPESATLRYHLAVGLERIGQKSEARVELSKALETEVFPERDSADRLFRTLVDE